MEFGLLEIERWSTMLIVEKKLSKKITKATAVTSCVIK